LRQSGRDVVLPTHLLLVSGLRMGWRCTSASPLCLHSYIMGWPRISWCHTLQNTLWMHKKIGKGYVW